MAAAVAALNAGGRPGSVSAAGRATLNASSRSGNPTRSQVPRYRRALMGRSSDPGRDRLRSGAGEAAVTVVQSRAGFGRSVSPWKRSGVGLGLRHVGTSNPRVNIGAGSDGFGVTGRNRRV